MQAHKLSFLSPSNVENAGSRADANIDFNAKQLFPNYTITILLNYNYHRQTCLWTGRP